MFKNYFKIAIRNLLKSKIYSFINITGLAIGIASCLLIMLFVTNEITYDQFHENSQNIYRVNYKFNLGTNRFDVAEGCYPVLPAMEEEYPEVKSWVRVWRGNLHGGSIYVSKEEMKFKEENFFWADSSFSDLFSVEVVEGNIKEALSIPNAVVINPQIAKKYFKDENPIGQKIKTHDGKYYEVRAIAKDFPENSHFHFDFLASLITFKDRPQWGWGGIDVHNYVLLDKNASWQDLDAKLKDFSKKYLSGIVQQQLSLSWDDFLASGNELSFFLQPLEDIHLTGDIHNQFEANGDRNTIYIFTAIALIILLIACVNFINLSTARSGQRASEIGIRKVVGSRKGQLISQFLTESILISYIALLLAFLVVEIALPFFNGLIDKNLSTGMFSITFYLSGFVFSGIIIGMIAGLYPAFAISSFKIISVLKGKFNTAQGKVFRNALVIFQFTISIVLFVGTMVIYQQLNFIRNKDLGFNKDQIVVVASAEKLGSNQEAFRTQLKQFSFVQNITYSGSLPQMNLEAQVFAKEEDSKNTFTFFTFVTDYEFMDAFKLRLHHGRYFNKNLAGDTAAVILNQAALAELGITNIENTRLVSVNNGNQLMKVIGVFEDFHTESLHKTIRPAAVRLKPEKRAERRLSIRVNASNMQESVAAIEKKWKEFLPNQEFDYTFYDQEFADLYKADIQSGKVFSVFALLAVIIAGLGMLGLTSFIIDRRTKEIGIRKVMGAAVPGILFMLFKDLLRWVVVANIFAWPIAWFAMNRWLNNFAFKTEISWWIFLASAVLALLIALTTVCFQAVKAAIANPVEALKYE